MEPNSPSRVGCDTLFGFGSEEQEVPVSCMFVDLISPLYVFGIFVDLFFFFFFCIFQNRKMMMLIKQGLDAIRHI
ncbi:hypothetical protein Hanom_Chr11g01030291 [Helianthus anomalus]